MPRLRGSTTAPLHRAIAHWFTRAARPLPWRTPLPRNPYHSLVSELMLQQTQVSRVIEKYTAFIAAFPTAHALARAPESQVLALWSGLGYYRRAKLLHRAAKAIVARHNGIVPPDLDDLLDLPGIGRYTAGAIASMAFGLPAPLVDGNVARVLFRIHGREATHADPNDMKWAWEQAESLMQSAVKSKVSPGALNEGLMELGATVCTPSNPRCAECPAREHCIALATGRQDEIPYPKKRTLKSSIYCESIIIQNAAGKLLIEQRPDAGMWAGLWQAPTLERPSATRHLTRVQLRAWLGAGELAPITRFYHQTSHRDVHFKIWRATSLTPAAVRTISAGRTWATPDQIAALAISNPQRRILLDLAPGRTPLD